MDVQYRAELDFDIIFSNGGSLHGQEFRIDIAGPDLSDAELGAALVRDLGLLMAGEVRITRREIIADRHKRAAPAGPPAAAGRGAIRHADLSHVITDGMVTVPGLPAPRVRAQSVSAALPPGRYAPGVSFKIGEITLCGNTSTYLDSPFHLLPAGADLAALPLERLADLDAIVVDLTGIQGRAITEGHFLPYEVAGKAVLIRTGWDALWGRAEYHTGHPFLTAGAARHLAGAGTVLVGIDAANIDDTGDPARPAHAVLLAAGTGVCEHLTGLGALPGSGFRFTAVPPKVARFGTFPVRAFATWAS
ncbi:MAG TPA: cyclase family protein [Streptosporangiaceae bacterium]|jgi:kynurenine formamidase